MRQSESKVIILLASLINNILHSHPAMRKMPKSLNLSGNTPIESPPKSCAPITPSNSKSDSKQLESNVRDEGTEGKVLISLLPEIPNTRWPPWCMDYLKALIADDVYTLGGAARIVDRHPMTIWETIQRYKDFAQAVERIKQYRDWWVLESLERGTLKRALECDPADRQSAWLSIQHLKARDHRYRDHGMPQSAGVINITFGAAIGGKEAQTMTVDLASGQEVKDAEFEDVKQP